MGIPPDRAHDLRRRMGPAEFQQLADTMNSGGGFSSRVYSDRPGIFPKATDAYMVGGLHAPEGHLHEPVAGEAIDQYAATHDEKLRRDDIYLGGWGNEVDVSQAFRPRTGSGIPSRDSLGALFGALYTGIGAGQDAIGEVDAEGDYVRDIPTASGMRETPHSSGPDRLRYGPNGWVWPQTYRTPQNLAHRAQRG